MNIRVFVGLTAVIAPFLHSVSDLIEYYQGGFSIIQLWINYIAFLPMPWLLLGIYLVQVPRSQWIGLVGALLYGAAFTYFSHTTLLALETHVATYEALWVALGITYTIHGALMVIGGLMFGISSWSISFLPRASILLFVSGLILNLIFALLPVPEISQIIGSTIRNVGLMVMGYGILSKHPEMDT